MTHWFNSWAKSKQSLELNKTWCSQLFAAVACRLTAVLYNVGSRLPGQGFATSVHQKHQTCLSASWSKQDWELQFKCSGMFLFRSLKLSNTTKMFYCSKYKYTLFFPIEGYFFLDDILKNLKFLENRASYDLLCLMLLMLVNLSAHIWCWPPQVPIVPPLINQPVCSLETNSLDR